MKKVVIKEIEVQYDENELPNIDWIKNIIQNNYILFLCILKSQKTINLIPGNDFDAFFYDALDKFFNNMEMKKMLNDPEILPALYIEYLIRQETNNKSIFLKSKLNLDDEILSSLIAYKYFETNGTFKDFVEYLKNKNSFNEILNWLKNTIRFQTYNFLLKIVTDSLREIDFDFLEIANGIHNIMWSTYAESNIPSNDSKTLLPSVSIEELNALFLKFLKFIKAPTDWKEMYIELKACGGISFEPKKDDTSTSICYRDEKNELKILIFTDGTIRSFSTLIHEFIHYVSMKNSTKPSQFSISEFPSIFFENLAAEFLRNSGYSQNVVDYVINERKQNNELSYMVVFPLLNDISSFIKQGEIKREDKIKMWKGILNIIRETKEKINKISNDSEITLTEIDSERSIDIERIVDQECDTLIGDFIKNGILVLDGYQYILDTILASEVLKKAALDSTVVPSMIEVTNKLNELNLSDILTLFSLQDIFNQFKNPKDLPCYKVREKIDPKQGGNNV